MITDSKMCNPPPTELDQLLPTPVSDRKSYIKRDGNPSRRRWFVIAGAATLALVLSIHSVMSHGSNRRHRHRGKERFNAKEQLSALQQLTEKSLVGVLPTANVDPSHLKSHHNSHPKGKIEVLKDKKHKHKGIEDDIYRCTSQVMIMRHCDKEVKVNINGKKVTRDKRDKFGDRHCSPKGKERSEYIASLFVDPDDYQELVEDNAKEVNDGIPPVPMIKSSLSKVSSAAAKKKPQFPTPHHLYALSAARPQGKPSKDHENFREIETITPLSKKFHLDVDDRFGVNDEGDLAADFFENLSKSVTENVGLHMRSQNTADSSSRKPEISQLCSNGMTVVNWKHSRIPILARALGCGTDQGCPKRYKGSDFDTMWLLTFQYSLLLEEGIEELDMESSVLTLESLSKAAQGSLRHHKKKHSHGSGNWKITAELVNEGFDSNS